MERVRGWLRLVHAPGLSTIASHRLLAQLGGLDAALATPENRLRAAGAGEEAAAVISGRHEPDGIARDLEWAAREGCHLLSPEDHRWPPRLATIADPPLMLYVQGDPELLSLPALAIVGSRHPTPAGRDAARDFARHLADAGLVIASGLALGIDGAAHEGALAAEGMTVAVIGTGPDRIYPARHADMARRIAAGGALVSEFPVGTPPAARNFPLRNRIISGLSIGTLVVEAALRSGSLISARHAMEQGREVFAIPGSIHNPLARGCHQLIRQGAKLVEQADDILEELAPQFELEGLASTAEDAAGEPSSAFDDDPEYAHLLEALDWEPRAVDDLATRSGLGAGAVASMLLRLELEGRIRVVPGGYYQRR